MALNACLCDGDVGEHSGLHAHFLVNEELGIAGSLDALEVGLLQAGELVGVADGEVGA